MRFTYQSLDARWFAAIYNYARDKKNARETSWYNRSFQHQGDVRLVARSHTLIGTDMSYVQCEEEDEYQWIVNKLLSDLSMLYGDPRFETHLVDQHLLGLICFSTLYDQLCWTTNKCFSNDMIEPEGRIQSNLKFVFSWHQV